MIESFKASPLLLLFIVSAIGYWIGNISIRGTRLGVAAVLFVGLGFGALDPELDVPEIVILLGLSIFVYTIGLSSGPGFFQTFRQRGLKDIALIIGILLFSALMTVGFHLWLGWDPAVSAGLLSGTWTNTPALAGLLDLIGNTQADSAKAAMSNAAVVGYSLSYPMGVLGVMIAISLMQRWLKIDYRAEEATLQKDYPISMNILRKTVEITNPAFDGANLRTLFQRYHRRVVFGRIRSQGREFLPNMDTVLRTGDQVVLVGNEKILLKAVEELGAPLDLELSFDRTTYDVRRLFVSNPAIAGKKIAALNLPENFSIVITRVQRGDIDLVATGETVLELGDRVLLVAHRSEMAQVAALFGNSYEALSHINLLSFGFGMALGLLLGMITFELPGGFSFQLGFAGGPLLVALVLGALRRTGPVVWTLPYSANLTLQQFGLILLLAGIGIRSGHTFLETLLKGNGGLLFFASAVIASLSAALGLWIGYKLFRIPFSLLIGMITNQPAVLDFSQQKAGNKLPSIGFTLMLPIAIIVKIVLVQVLFVIL